MPVQIYDETKAIKDLKVLDAKERARIIAQIAQYADNPASLTNMVIHLTKSPFYRLRVGDCRVIFPHTDGTATVMTVLRVRHRSDAHE